MKRPVWSWAAFATGWLAIWATADLIAPGPEYMTAGWWREVFIAVAALLISDL